MTHIKQRFYGTCTKKNLLSTTLTIRLCNSMIFCYYGSNMDKQVRIRYNISKLQKLIRIELLKRLGDVGNESNL